MTGAQATAGAIEIYDVAGRIRGQLIALQEWARRATKHSDERPENGQSRNGKAQ